LLEKAEEEGKLMQKLEYAEAVVQQYKREKDELVRK
jgi:hypothetical protein